MTDSFIAIGVIGSGACDENVSRIASKVGELIAEKGAVLVCGGLGGVMEAACGGASKKGGITIGILPGSDLKEANRYVKIPIATGMGHGRNVIIASTAQALIAIAGEYGTLSEISIALKLGKPVVSIEGWSEIEGVIPAATPEEAVEKIFAYIK